VSDRNQNIITGIAVVAVALVLSWFLMAQTGCASSPEVREARKAAAIQTAQRLAQCAVAGGLTCAPETAALVGCAVANGLDCKAERAVWGQCIQARAIACGLAAGVSLASGAADGPPVRVADGCAAGAAELCADLAGDAAAVEACLAESLVPCVD
jgi:hypothetical protein